MGYDTSLLTINTNRIIKYLANTIYNKLHKKLLKYAG